VSVQAVVGRDVLEVARDGLFKLVHAVEVLLVERVVDDPGDDEGLCARVVDALVRAEEELGLEGLLERREAAVDAVGHTGEGGVVRAFLYQG